MPQMRSNSNPFHSFYSTLEVFQLFALFKPAEIEEFWKDFLAPFNTWNRIGSD
jgi:hypothetical protein